MSKYHQTEYSVANMQQYGTITRGVHIILSTPYIFGFLFLVYYFGSAAGFYLERAQSYGKCGKPCSTVRTKLVRDPPNYNNLSTNNARIIISIYFVRSGNGIFFSIFVLFPYTRTTRLRVFLLFFCFFVELLLSVHCRIFKPLVRRSPYA